MFHPNLLILFFVFLQQSAGTVTDDDFLGQTNEAKPSSPHPQTPSECARCTRAEREVWILNDEFTQNYLEASANAWGDSESTTEALYAIYSDTISKPCLGCLGDTTQCGRDKCFLDCLLDQRSLACDNCINLNCLPTLLSCTGAKSTAELPNRVRTSVTTASPLSPVRTRRVAKTPSVSNVKGSGINKATNPDDSWINPPSKDCQTWLVLLLALTSIGVGFINAYRLSS